MTLYEAMDHFKRALLFAASFQPGRSLPTFGLEKPIETNLCSNLIKNITVKINNPKKLTILNHLTDLDQKFLVRNLSKA